MSLNLVKSLPLSSIYEEWSEELEKTETKFRHSLEEALMRNFWPQECEHIQIEGRVKNFWSLYKKIQSEPALLKKFEREFIEKKISDLVAFRIITPTKRFFSHLYKAISEHPDFRVFESIGYSNSVDEQNWYRSIGIKNIESKDSGYSGMHLVVLFEGHPVEVQIRTSQQHAWQEFDHLFYKINDLPDLVEKMRPSISHAVESVTLQQENLCDSIQYSMKEIPHSLQALGLNLDSEDRPKNWIGKLVKISSDPKIYLVLNEGQIIWVANQISPPKANFPKEVADVFFGTNWESTIMTVKDVDFIRWNISFPPRVDGDFITRLQRDGEFDKFSNLLRQCRSGIGCYNLIKFL